MSAGTLPAVAATETEPEYLSKNERGELVLDLASLRPKPRWLTVPVVGEDEPQTVRIPGNLPLAKMMEFQAIESQLESDLTEAEAVAELDRLCREFEEIIGKENPDRDKLRIELDARQAVVLFGFLSRPHDSMAELWVHTLTDGRSEKPDAASDDAHEIAKAGGIDDALQDGKGEARPLRSGKRSSSRSSASERSTTGRPSGGSSRGSRGKRSASTSRTRSASSGSESAND